MPHAEVVVITRLTNKGDVERCLHYVRRFHQLTVYSRYNVETVSNDCRRSLAGGRVCRPSGVRRDQRCGANLDGARPAREPNDQEPAQGFARRNRLLEAEHAGSGVRQKAGCWEVSTLGSCRAGRHSLYRECRSLRARSTGRPSVVSLGATSNHTRQAEHETPVALRARRAWRVAQPFEKPLGPALKTRLLRMLRSLRVATSSWGPARAASQ